MPPRMEGTVIGAGKARDAKEAVSGRSGEGQGHREERTASGRASLSLPGGPAAGTRCARAQKRGATWPSAPRSDLENTVNGVKMSLSPVTLAQASLTAPNACDIYEPTRLAWQRSSTESP